jgi:hypothetical protein
MKTYFGLYTIIFGLKQFIVDPWTHISSVGSKQTMSTLSHRQSHVGADYVTYLLTYLITPWSRVLLEKLTGSAASQEIPCILLNPKVY